MPQKVLLERRELIGALVGATLAAVASRRANAHAGPHAPAAVAPGAASPVRSGLVDHTGRRFELPRLAGRPTLLTFGFTQCSSTCPVSLATAADLLARTGPGRVQVVFVSLDPLADTPARLAKYLAAFSPSILGVTGEPSAIEAMADAFRVAVQRGGQDGIAHSAMWYLLDERATVRAVAKYETPAGELQAQLMRASLAAR